MLQLILHIFGDYFLQTDWQALHKKKPGIIGFWACLKQCTFYSIPFLFVGSWKAVLVIFITHFIIDRTNIIAYLLAIKNNVRKQQTSKMMPLSFPYTYDISNFGLGLDRPFAISIWIYIIVDNLFHIVCNYLALKYL